MCHNQVIIIIIIVIILKKRTNASKTYSPPGSIDDSRETKVENYQSIHNSLFAVKGTKMRIGIITNLLIKQYQNLRARPTSWQLA